MSVHQWELDVVSNFDDKKILTNMCYTISFVQNLLKRCGIPYPRILSQKTHKCKHINGCYETIIYDTFKSFNLAYAISSLINLIKALLNGKKNKNILMKLIETLQSTENVKFAMFPASYTFVLKSTTCFFRKFTNVQQKQIDFLSGMLAGYLSLTFINKSSRITWVTFLISRAIDITYQNLISKGKIPQFKLDYVIMMGVLSAMTGYAFCNEPDLLKPQLFKFYSRFGNFSNNDLIIMKSYAGIAAKNLK